MRFSLSARKLTLFIAAAALCFPVLTLADRVTLNVKAKDYLESSSSDKGKWKFLKIREKQRRADIVCNLELASAPGTWKAVTWTVLTTFQPSKFAFKRTQLQHFDTLICDNSEWLTERRKLRKFETAEAKRLELSYAVKDGDLEKCKTLLQEGTEGLFEFDDEGRTPLHHAAIHGNLEILQLLISHGARTDARSGITGPGLMNRTPFLDAVSYGSLESVKALAPFIDPETEVDEEEVSPLSLAAERGDIAIFDFIIKNHLFKRETDHFLTALTSAMDNGHFSLAKSILNHPEFPLNTVDELMDRFMKDRNIQLGDKEITPTRKILHLFQEAQTERLKKLHESRLSSALCTEEKIQIFPDPIKRLIHSYAFDMIDFVEEPEEM